MQQVNMGLCGKKARVTSRWVGPCDMSVRCGEAMFYSVCPECLLPSQSMILMLLPSDISSGRREMPWSLQFCDVSVYVNFIISTCSLNEVKPRILEFQDGNRLRERKLVKDPVLQVCLGDRERKHHVQYFQHLLISPPTFYHSILTRTLRSQSPMDHINSLESVL